MGRFVVRGVRGPSQRLLRWSEYVYIYIYAKWMVFEGSRFAYIYIGGNLYWPSRMTILEENRGRNTYIYIHEMKVFQKWSFGVYIYTYSDLGFLMIIKKKVRLAYIYIRETTSSGEVILAYIYIRQTKVFQRRRKAEKTRV